MVAAVGSTVVADSTAAVGSTAASLVADFAVVAYVADSVVDTVGSVVDIAAIAEAMVMVAADGAGAAGDSGLDFPGMATTAIHIMAATRTVHTRTMDAHIRTTQVTSKG